MRLIYRISMLALLLVVVEAISISFAKANSRTDLSGIEQAAVLPNLSGDAALKYLKEHGEYDRLANVVKTETAKNAFANKSQTFVESSKLMTNDRASYDLFGDTVAISGNTAIIGAPYKSKTASSQGAAYVFVRSGTTWILQQTLFANDAAKTDFFGRSIAIDGDTTIIGAPFADVGTNCGGGEFFCDEGAAYIFVRTEDVWVQQQKLISVDPMPRELFANNVALKGETIVVSEHLDNQPGNEDPGKVNIFVRNQSGVWVLQQRLTPSDQDVFLFGLSVAIDENSIIVGAPRDETPNGNKGSAYVFIKSGDNWIQQQKLTASDGESGDFFGVSVAISGDTVAVGAYFNDVSGRDRQGSAYVFKCSGASWAESQKLTASDGAAADKFGSSVAMSADTIIVGSYFSDIGANNDQGAAYVFRHNGANWVQNQKLTDQNGTTGEIFGESVAIDSGTIVVGAIGGVVGTVRRGAAFVFTPPPATPPRTPFDFDGDGRADISVFRPDVGAWYIQRSRDGFAALQWGANGDLIVPADYDGDGKTDPAVFRPSNGYWYIFNLANSTMTATQFGLSGDLPRPADFDGDGLADICVFRPSSGSWFRINSRNNLFVSTQFGLAGDAPQPNDFDGDGRADISVWRPSNGIWYRLNSSTGAFVQRQWGLTGDIPVPADFDADGRTDYAVFRPSNKTWYQLNSSNGAFVQTFFSLGLDTDVPVVADYDGDKKADIAFWRASNGFWYQSNSTDFSLVTTQFGVSGDVPTQSAFNR